MKIKIPIGFAVAAAALLPLPVFAAGVVINEVAWMGTAESPSNEWIELKNTGDTPVDIEEWTLSAQDGTPAVSFGAGSSISAHSFFLLERTDDTTVPNVTADQLYTGALSNDEPGEYLTLKNSAGEVIDEVNGTPKWPAGDNVTKETMQRSGNGWVTAPSTPRAENATSGPLPVVSATPQPSAQPSTTPKPTSTASASQTPPPKPSFTASAGPDKTTVVGSIIDFFGSALGYKNEPLEGARYLWNFGDGQTDQGKHVSHLFRIPGTYTVSLHVSNDTDMASDYATITVIPNQIQVAGVVPGEDGYITLKNGTQAELNIGGWVLEDGSGARFYLPPETMIGSGVQVAFSNDVTGVMKTESFPLTVRYSHGGIAMRYDAMPPQASPQSSPSASPKSSASDSPIKTRKPVSPEVASVPKPHALTTVIMALKESMRASAEPQPIAIVQEETQTQAPDIAVVQQPAQSGWYGWFFAIAGSLAAAGIFFAGRRYSSHA